MTLQELEKTLASHPDKPFGLLLPGGNPVPVSFHVTEVGRVQKTFVDCGGKMHRTESCQLQVWIGPDQDHRIEAGKMASILQKARAILPDADIPVEVEYGNDAASQYPVIDHSVSQDGVILKLGNKQTDCLAKNECGATESEGEAATPCCGTGCGCK